ncbi:MAG: hypothetical protein EOP84_05160 [Verrucomicrobiaceae bacterium]|nr:MAG: hypothetical protein EOP84_05160 [Verrucomicrobiaceae bacterium]
MNFEDAVKKWGWGLGAPMGGNLGPVSSSTIPPSVYSVLLSLKPGEISPVIHDLILGPKIVKLVRRMSFDEVDPGRIKDEFREFLTRRLKNDYISRLAKELRCKVNQEAVGYLHDHWDHRSNKVTAISFESGKEVQFGKLDHYGQVHVDFYREWEFETRGDVRQDFFLGSLGLLDAQRSGMLVTKRMQWLRKFCLVNYYLKENDDKYVEADLNQKLAVYARTPALHLIRMCLWHPAGLEDQPDLWARATEALSQVKGGMPWPAVLQKYAYGVPRWGQGDIGIRFAAELDPLVYAQCRELEDGQFTQVMRTKDGYEFFQKVGVAEYVMPGSVFARKAGYNDSRIRRQMAQRQGIEGQKRVQTLLRDLRSRASISLK